jgi:uncharacterized protein YkwD
MSARTAMLVAPRKFAAVALTLTAVMTGLIAVGHPAGAATAPETNASLNVLHLLNAERAANHLPALAWSNALVSSARRHNLNMAKANSLSHQLPGEPAFSTRISQAGVAWHFAAENIGWTTNRSSIGAMGMETSMYIEKAPENGHRLNILSRSVRYIGVDSYIDAHTGKLWLTEDFADATSAAPAVKAAPDVHAPIGNLDSASALPGRRVQLSGWAMDRDAKTTALYIGTYIDGKFAGFVRGPIARPDVAKSLGAGPYQGYRIIFTVPAGIHTITTYAVNVSAGPGMARLASKTVRVL